jgi:hypothetical protein
MSDGVDLLAWEDGGPAPNPRNWGISIGPFSGLSGPNPPGTGADVTVSGGAVWSNPSNVTSQGASYASVVVGTTPSGNTGATTPTTFSGWGTGLPLQVSLGPGQTSGTLIAQGLGFSVPAGASITGVVVAMTRTQSSGTSALYTNAVTLTGVACQGKSDQYNAGDDWSQLGTPSYGGQSDTWGATLTPAIVNSATFGVSLTAVATGGPGNGASGEITALTITVYYVTTLTTVSDLLEATNYDFNLPTSGNTTIQGIVVTLTGYQAANNPGSLTVQLLVNGSPAGTPKTGIQLPTSAGNVALGALGDFWGNTLGAADVSAVKFGVAIQGLNATAAPATWYVSDAQISLYATGGPPITVTGSGTCAATVGYQYAAAYGNSNSKHVCTCTPISASTGPYTGKGGVQVSLTASTDPQVNQIWLFRTADGGSSLYATPASPYPNTTQNVTDTTATSSDDPMLNILLPAPIDHSNDPPQPGWTIPVYHMGRVWMANGNTLQCSGGPDTITGNGSEAFPPDNFFTLPSIITRMLTTAAGLVVFMVDRVMVLAGGPSIAQFYVQPLVDGIGLLSFDALDIYGSTAYLVTADRQFMSFDMSSGVNEIGFPIEDKIRTISPSLATLAYHTTGTDRGVFLGDGVSTWYRCTPQQPPDFTYTGPVWSPPGIMAGGAPVSLIKSLETSDGNRQLLCASGTTLGYRDSSFQVFTDFGTAYSAFFTVGSIILANPGQLAELGFITADFARVGSSPAMALLMDEINGTPSRLPTVVQDPPRLYGVGAGPASLYSNRYYFRQSTASGGTPGPVWCRHLQIQVSFGNDTVQNEILSNTIWGTILEEGAA